MKARVVAGDPVPWSLLGHASLYGIAYITILLIIAGLVFRSRNIK